MNVTQLIQELAQHNPSTHTVLRDPESGLIHSLKRLLEEQANYGGYKDHRCGPHSLPFRPSSNDRPILHLGQQSWYGNYPPSPDTETVGALLQDLQHRDPDRLIVITHHFDEFIDVDLLMSLDNVGTPMMWGNPGSNLNPWPTDCRTSPPDRVLLISNTENEAYSALRRATDRYTTARVITAMADRPALRKLDMLPMSSRAVPRTRLMQQLHTTQHELQKAWDTFERVTQTQQSSGQPTEGPAPGC